ncbi:MAG: P1 family peptidase [[Eubacterium] sulci]|jgi:peptidase family T4|nr:P1 family peptidase [[Eubacterium] sulci]MBF1157476.1 P1 family peptidase [[Eubacterium] sulci]MBF1172360.1 P1 family peptidase [[Eubacterium] sulci]MBF1177574.1 P1 family peptidase [[Eubacterium] sulci]MBF1192512.1 P1 family peptidase [[Eubacterium] sulci]
MGLPKDCGLELHHKWKSGKLNKITDVKGLKVASVTIQDNEINTGVTVILPHEGNIFRSKVVAGASVLNGFGKSLGIVQLKELGNIETPIIMTNTLSVGEAATALTKYCLEQNEDIGVSTGTVNPLVTECNDGRLNDIRGFHVREEHVREALRLAEEGSPDFEEGAVGAGTGMCCLGFKGGIGSASRLVELDGSEYTIGALVLSNFGEEGNLVIGGRHYGSELLPKVKERLKSDIDSSLAKDKGSIIMLIATDIPMSSRQLERVANRAAIALGRTGSYMGNGSGDIAIAFSTANRMPHYSDEKFVEMKAIHEDAIDKVFEPAVEALEESIISSLYHAKTTLGVRGKLVYGLREFI